MFDRQKIRPGSKYLVDESKLTGTAEYLICPFDESELREAVRINHSKGNKMTVSAMRTGVCGGCVPPGGYVISLERMKGIVGIGKDEHGFFVRTLPCTTIAELNRRLMERRFEDLVDITPGAREQLIAESMPWFYPVDPTETEGSIGGNIACNSSGPRTYKYGPAGDWVRGLHVVLPNGQDMRISRGDIRAHGRRITFPAGRELYSFDVPSYDFNRKVKNSAGPRICEDMDLLDLFIGSEGSFGIIAEADVYLTPWHPLVSVVLFMPSDDDALSAVKEIRSDDALDPEFLEFMDCGSINLLRRVKGSDPALLRIPDFPEAAGAALFLDLPDDDTLPDALERLSELAAGHGCKRGMTWCGSEEADRKRMREMRHAIPRSVFEYVASLKSEMPRIHKMGTDMSVPDEAADEMMSYYRKRLGESGLEYVMFGHIGNNHPHVEIILKSMEDLATAEKAYMDLAKKAVSLGGSATAEHGIGKIKTSYMELMYGEKGVEELRRVKNELDPKGVLCPGNIFGADP